MPVITLLPEGKTVEAEQGANLLDSLDQAGIYIKTTCGGVGKCGSCKIVVASGEENLSSPTIDEIKLLGNVFHITKERLACQVKVDGDCSIDISEQDLQADNSQRAKKTTPVVVRKSDDKFVSDRNFDKKEKIAGLGGNKRPKFFNFQATEDVDTEKSFSKPKPKPQRKSFRKK